jgi:acetyl-CoA carboxylase carboxyltransferase component
MSDLDIRAPMACTVVEVLVSPGDTVQAGRVLMVLEAMKMEHELRAESAASVLQVTARAGESVAQGEVLLRTRAGAAPDGRATTAAPGDPAAGNQEPASTKMRDDLLEVIARHAWTLDAQRPEAIAKRHARGQRSARENIADLCDAHSFVEYGALALAAQSQRRSHDDLVRNTPADGMVTGIGSVNAARFGPQASRCAVLAYDATVLAGTQGFRNHQKTDRLLGIAARESLPVVLFAEGGGGRPGDTDMPIVAGLHVPTFASFARLSGKVPVVGIAAGRCFAGNAALLGCCDVVIATRDSNIGMGGPAMVEGGGLGTFAPENIGPSEVQQRNGVIDVLVNDEAHAVRVAQRYLAFFQGRVAAPAVARGAAGAAAERTEMVRPPWSAADQTALRETLPENRVRVYDMRRVLQLLADEDSLLELRAGFGVGIFTALARIEGRAIGLMASNPAHLGGAIDADAADKAARFMQLCDAFGLPIVSLVDTPGFMVGPEIETRAQVRHVSRMFVVGAQLSVPLLAVVLRKGYGLGAMAMTGGGFHATLSTVAWPSGEFGGMGLEGAVRLGYRKELEAVPAGAERDALYEELVARQYAAGKAINMAATLEIDAVIDPATTREWLTLGLASALQGAGSRRFIDPW